MATEAGAGHHGWLKSRAPAWLAPASLALAVVEALCVLGQALLLAWLIAAAIIDGADLVALRWPLAGLLAVLALRALVGGLRGSLSAQASGAVRQQLRSELFSRMVDAGPLLKGRLGTGALTTVLVEQTETLDPYYARFLPQMATVKVVPLAILGAVFWANWLAGVLLLLSAPLIPVFMILIGMGAQQVSRDQQQAMARLSGLFFDRLQGMDTLRRFGAEQRESRRIAAFAEDFRRRTMQVLRVAFLSSAVLEFFSAIAIATLAVYIGLGLLGYIQLGPTDSLTLFSGLFILLLAPEFYNPLRTLAQHWHDRAGALAAAAGIREVLATPPARPEPAQPAAGLPARACTVEVRGVQLALAGRNALFTDLELHVAAGEKLVIAGASGSGKSTLLALVGGFLQADAGDILLGGTPVAALTRAQLSQVRAYLGQQPFLAAASIRDNILLGAVASDEALARAVTLAGLDEFLHTLPEGLATRLGQDGLGVSGGQARRIALARVLLTPRPLLLLDEPTASLDAATEQRFWDDLDRALAAQPMTVICASHSALALRWADRTLRLQDGRLREHGREHNT
ncbi:MAG: thiol reductant ABC exporter subunit CydD [Gammaproteobacteria bacterium]